MDKIIVYFVLLNKINNSKTIKIVIKIVIKVFLYSGSSLKGICFLILFNSIL